MAIALDNVGQREIYTISRLNQEVRELLEGEFPLLWIEGELSNLARPSSGHLYFSLKDSSAQVRCAMFRMRNTHLGFTPENGLQVLVRARISLYEARGDYQLIVEQMEEAGDGALRRAFEQLKQRLSAEGLFDPENKKPLPLLPKRIGIVTSPTGAAIRDILSVLKRRFPAIPVMIYPVPVQGAAAAPEIARMIDVAAQRNECDVLIIARGGGSLEDLWAFSDETVARAIHRCPIPTVSGIGHEIDFTIADFVADLRAPTPSGAAELVSPDQHEWMQTMLRHDARLYSLLNNHVVQKKQQLAWLGKRLQQQHPGQRLRHQAQRLDDLEQRLQRGLFHELRHLRSQLNGLSGQLFRHTPVHRINQYQTRFQHLNQSLGSTLKRTIEKRRQLLLALIRALDTVSPLATLGRGYAIIERLPDHKVLHAANEVKCGTTIEARLASGKLSCTVTDIHDK